VADAASGWLRIALPGAPLVLVTLAGNGWNARRCGHRPPMRIRAARNGLSALACPVLVYGPRRGAGVRSGRLGGGERVGPARRGRVVLRALLSERVSARPVPALLRAQLAMGRDLVLRQPRFPGLLSCRPPPSRPG